MTMKKFISGLNASFALAVLAVCSVFMTACYEKPAPSPVVEPVPAVYHITGTVSDGVTGVAVSGVSVKINGTEVPVSNGSFQKQVSGPGEYKVAVSAEGYLDVTRTVQVVEVDDDQVSITSVDIAIFNSASLPADVTFVGDGNLSVEELEKLGFENVEGLEEGYFVVVDSEKIEATDKPFEVVYKEKEGFIFTEATATKAIDETAYIGTALSKSTGMPFYNNSFKEVEETTTIGGDGRVLVGYNVLRAYAIEDYDVTMYDANTKRFSVIYEWFSVVTAVYDVHDNHDNHDNADDSHDNHDNHDNHHSGATAVGGGLGNEQ